MSPFISTHNFPSIAWWVFLFSGHGPLKDHWDLERDRELHLSPRHRGSWGPSSSSLLLPRKENKCWSWCSLTPDPLTQWRGTRRNMKPLNHTPPALPPRASICLGAMKLHLTLKRLPAHRPPSHRRDIPAPGRDLALNGCRESCLSEIIVSLQRAALSSLWKVTHCHLRSLTI